MNWYYQCNDAAQGPVSEETFRSLVARGVIRPDTLVWHEGMAEWQPLSVADPGLAGTRPIDSVAHEVRRRADVTVVT